MNGRELLEMAAKAIGCAHLRYCKTHMAMVPEPEGEEALPFSVWNPLTDDGDALRLAVVVGIDVDQYVDRVETWKAGQHGFIVEAYGDDPCAATRRAIVRAAAAIGSAM